MSELIFTPQADSDLRELETNPAKKHILKAVRKTLGFLETNLRHPSLQTHEYISLKKPNNHCDHNPPSIIRCPDLKTKGGRR